eukprot:CAMPEP_0204032352 /NCGR_PEP_ID=MMETSP0360-20130528/66002_1 /ASSEMBLY_ACC=CAM_ASM_000342 /TAXON_ID=268821 /ORGANISM="Scrippsiella Hangoei, Strain SHTV-5" /LENGTH=88 /DNA_ID=CAMNT_0050976751 /DNA_START=90 /DNA_END=353 /DNA_ORIENTATION=+
MERLTSGSGTRSSLGEISSVGLNQDGSCIVVIARRGFSILDVETCQPLYQEYFHACGGVVREVEMLFQTSLLALVGGTAESRGQLTMW